MNGAELLKEELSDERCWEEESQGHRNIYLDAARERVEIAWNHATGHEDFPLGQPPEGQGEALSDFLRKRATFTQGDLSPAEAHALYEQRQREIRSEGQGEDDWPERPVVDPRITRVRYGHPSALAATEGDRDWLPVALRMAGDNGGSVAVYLSDYQDWFTLVEGPRWRIETLRAAFAVPAPDGEGR